MPRILFTTAYDGRNFYGWQSQPRGNTVQDIIESVAGTILEAPVRIHASGRTDSGVHAEGQTFHLDTPETCRIPTEKWPQAFNARLPDAIRITGARFVPEDFHARYSAQGKTYLYRIDRNPILTPFRAGLAWHLPLPVDEKLFAQAISLYEGTHDFRAFAANRGNEPSPSPPGFFTRTIHSARLQAHDGMLELTFHGTGFLYRMVRLLVGAAYQVARGKESLEELHRLLENPGKRKSSFCAPPDGLYLQRVDYELATPPGQ